MTAQTITNPLPIFNDRNGVPLTGGYVYIGEPNTDPRTNPLNVFYDEDLLLPASQPLRTLGGYLYRNGAPTSIWVDGAYSVLVLDSNRRQVYYLPEWVMASASAVTYIATGTGAVTRDVQSKLREHASILDFGAAGGGADDSDAFSKAAAAAYNVFVPPGTWYCNVDDLPSNTHFHGVGELSVIKPYDIAARCALGCDSGAAASFITDLRFSNLKFLGNVASNGFSEQCHLLDLNGVKRLRIQNCYFEGARGDGVYVGSGHSAGERHNLDVVIRDCVFDGVNNQNRNGLSVIDVDGLVLDGNTFRNWSRSNMPGSVDFEPNDSFSIIKNVRVTNNKFSNCNGNRGHVTISVHNVVAANVSNILVAGNQFDGNVGVRLHSHATLGTALQGLLIIGNTATGCDYLLYHFEGSWYGMTVTGNSATGTTVTTGRLALIRNNTGTEYLKSAEFVNNQVTTIAPIALAVSKLDTQDVTIAGNVIRGATQAHVRIGETGATTTYISITDNILNGSTPSQGAVEHAGTNYGALTNTFRGNTIPVGVSHSFRAVQTDNGGATANLYDATTLPSAFAYGKSVTRITNLTVITAGNYGMLYTHRENSIADTTTWQEFVPQYDATYKKRFYRRKAIDSSNWDAWYLFEGV